MVPSFPTLPFPASEKRESERDERKTAFLFRLFFAFETKKAFSLSKQKHFFSFRASERALREPVGWGGKKTLLFCCFERDEVFFFSRARAPLNIPPLSFFQGPTTEKAKFSSLCLLRRVEAFEKLTLSPLKKRKKNIQKKHPNSKLKKKQSDGSRPAPRARCATRSGSLPRSRRSCREATAPRAGAAERGSGGAGGERVEEEEKRREFSRSIKKTKKQTISVSFFLFTPP